MTTIAYDGITLAGDTQTSMFRDSYPKLQRLSDGRLYGACGEVQDMVAVQHWLERGGDRPKCEDGYACIVIDQGKCLHYEHKLIAMPVGGLCFSVGSGRDYAMAAMHLGMSAAEAVRVAHVFDISTGSEVMELTQPAHPALSATWTGIPYGKTVSGIGYGWPYG